MLDIIDGCWLMRKLAFWCPVDCGMQENLSYAGVGSLIIIVTARTITF